MAIIANHPLPVEDKDQLPEETLLERFWVWVRTELVWYGGSFSFHLFALSLLLLLPNFGGGNNQGDAPVFESKPDDVDKREPEKFDPVVIGDVENIKSLEFNFDPTQQSPARAPQDAQYYDESKVFKQSGCGGVDGRRDLASTGNGALAFGHGPKLLGPAGIGPGPGPGKRGAGFDIRDSGFRDFISATVGRNKYCQPAVTAALVWLANHQMSDGSWSLQNYTQCCKDKSCSGASGISADAGATAMGILPFLAIGQTHKTQGPYKEHILRGVQWLMAHQQPDGNLAKGAQQMMYSHALATIALSEDYGMSGDKQVGAAAQAAVNFIINAQNVKSGGWRYNPGDDGDTSVVGWQLMALKSALMAELSVNGSAFSGTSKWLDSVAVHDGAEYGYTPGGGSSPTMTSVGLLCRQYLGAKRDSPMLAGGMGYLLNHLPDDGFSNIYYWYYATQVMHNMSGYEWDTWNRKMRDLLVRTQVRSVHECANGSWAPEKDAWGRSGGRLMQTSLSALTLEIYYRYLPLFKTGEGDGAGTAAKAGE
jgi:hypothetical protein